ncbi:MAG TPA: type II toxin-antitoxin system RelE/ParE family toxin [Thermoanaerobaculia bacterium]|nr:type II toxin-antitoxin system RelE/ParE family toxin [Thermoanaerobaculia bacterium]HUM30923.1 type II toxin-antitoxin system RelE/ParE family toxin [Thermoanaerobaculia bacterium]HXK69256.1 type II toxin-antitoxin system RelE/ParE family toxin [Thermoanaerobaculia bacterium]
MGNYKIVFKSSAIKELEEIALKKDRNALITSISSLSDNPRPRGCKKMTSRSAFRIRKGIYGVIYQVDDERQLVKIFKIGKRREVYR